MKGPGILSMVQIAAGFSMAGPMFVVGFQYLRAGRFVGGVGFLALGLIALYFPTYIIDRVGGPRAWIRRRLGRFRSQSGDDGDGDDEDSDLDEGVGGDETGETDETDELGGARSDTADASSRSNPLDRLRRR